MKQASNGLTVVGYRARGGTSDVRGVHQAAQEAVGLGKGQHETGQR